MKKIFDDELKKKKEIEKKRDELSRFDDLEASQETEKSNIKVMKSKKIEIPDKLSNYFSELKENGINAYIMESSDEKNT